MTRDLRASLTSLITLTTVTALVAAPAIARADDASIGGLEALGPEAAAEIAEQIACTSPAARRYFAPTLRTLRDRSWGFLREHLEADARDLVLDAIYHAARSETKTEALEANVARPKATCAGADLEAARAALERESTSAMRTDLDACAASGMAGLRSDPACALALAAGEAYDGTPQSTARALSDLLVSVSFDRLYVGKTLTKLEVDELFENSIVALRGAATAGEGTRTILHEVSEVFGRKVSLDTVRADSCDDGELVEDLTRGVLSSQEVFCEATRPDLEPEKIAVRVKTPSGATVATTLAAVLEASTRLEHALFAGSGVDMRAEPRDELVAEAVICAASLAPADRAYADCSGDRVAVKKAGTFEIEVGKVSWKVALATKSPAVSVSITGGVSLAALVGGLGEVEQVRGGLEGFLEERLLGMQPRPESLRELAAYTLSLWRVAHEVSAFHDGQSQRSAFLGTVQSLPELIDRAVGPMPGDAPGCDAPSQPARRIACKALPGGSLEPALEAIDDRRIRALTLRSASLLAPESGAKECDAARNGRVLRGFAAFVADVDADGNEQPIDPFAETQLRSAVRDVDACSSGSSAGARERVTFTIAPSPALRFSWSSGYVNAWGADGFRIAPSLDALAVRVPLATGRASHVMLRASLVDLLAPLVEMAMRRGDLTYEEKGAGLIEFLRPRVDVMFVAPRVSSHLFVSGGVSLRPVAPFVGSTNPGAPRTPDRARYVPIWSGRDEASAGIARFVEANVAMGYTF